jgi:hypothetical protein
MRKHVGLLPFTPLMKSPTGVEAEDWLRCPLILKFPWGSPQLSHFHLIERGLLGMRTLAKNRSRKTSTQQIMTDFSIISPTENLTKKQHIMIDYHRKLCAVTNPFINSLNSLRLALG